MTEPAPEQPAPATAPVKLGRNGKPKRPKAGNPGRSATREQSDERVEFTARMVAKLLYPSEIKRGFIQKFGEMSARNIENYISRARKLLQKQAQMPPEQAKDLAVSQLLDIMRSGKPGERTGALRLWADIHGLTAPVKLEHAGKDGGPILTVEATCDVSKLSVEQLSVLRDALEAGRPEPKQIGDAKAE